MSELKNDQQQLIQENSGFSQQLYVLKTKFQGEGALTSDQEKIERIEKDQMVQILKRNHDMLMEKYEIFRNRNESLEKMAVEKESLYNEIKIDFDKLSQGNFKLQKTYEELRNNKEILDAKLRKVEENVRGKDETYKSLKIQKDRYEGQCKVLNEQLSVIQNSYDELSSKKANEIDLLSKEINSLSLKSKDSRQKVNWAENEINELKDQLRSTTNELDTRT